jgi:succinoglycan biosynthesis protein ExoA
MTLQNPFVSIVMPIRNEADFIAKGLTAVLNQTYPHDRMEVLIADGMSDDATRDIVQQVADMHDVPVTIYDNPQQIVPPGLNIVTAHAKGDIIIRVDGHCEIAPDYVAKCVMHLQKDGIDAVGGPIETIGSTLLAQSIAVAMSTPFGVGGSAFRTVKDESMFVDTVAFPAYTREAVEAAGPYDEEQVRNQDDEYNYRLRELGFKILLAHDVQSTYYSRGSIPKLWRQYYQYGYWKVRVMQKHPRQMSLRQFVPVTFVTALLGSALLALPFKLGRYLLALVAGAYLTANLLASLWTARQYGQEHLPNLPIVFATLHFSYGLGFLRGLIEFRDRWSEPHTPVASVQSTDIL